MKRRFFLVCLFFCFFLDCRSTNLLRLFSGNLPAMCSVFWSQIGVVVLVTPKWRQNEWFCDVKSLCSNFTVEWEKGVWTKFSFLAKWFFYSHAAISCCIFTVFSIFWIGFFNGFPNPFIVLSRTSFLFEPNFHFWLVVFCSHVAFWHCFFCFLILFF